jgi:hypothetical protein
VQTSQLITTFRAAITKRGSSIPLVRRSQPRRGAVIAYGRYGGTVATRPLPRQSAPAIGEPVATGREIVVSRVLILVRASLIAFTRGLVVIRPGLILIARRLVLFGPGLIPVTAGLVAIGREPIISRQLGTARRTGGNRALFAAGWTSHDLRHRLFPPERAGLVHV